MRHQCVQVKRNERQKIHNTKCAEYATLEVLTRLIKTAGKYLGQIKLETLTTPQNASTGRRLPETSRLLSAKVNSHASSRCPS